MINKYEYVYEPNIINHLYNRDGYLSIPLFIDFDFNDIKNSSIPSYMMIDPFLSLYKNNKNEVSSIANNIFGKDIIIKNDKFYLYSESEKEKDIKNIDKLIIFTIFHINKGNRKFIIPFHSSYNNINNPFYFKQFIDALNIKDIYITFISDDKDWLSIYNHTINHHNLYWVEGEFDKFTYNFFMPDNKYKIAGNWLNIIRIIEIGNVHHYGIIDKDGFSALTRDELLSNNILLSKYAECENIWMIESILNVFEKNVHNFSKNDFKNDLIKYAEIDKEDTINRFINRQRKLEELGYPYHKNTVYITDKYKQDLDRKNYDSILTFYDNKAMFNLLLKRLSCKNIKSFYELVNKIKKQIKILNITPVI